jgi:phosphatidylglycerol:prolipoprotein diacylglycerol transferase
MSDVVFGYLVHHFSPFLIEFGGGWGVRYYGLAYVIGFLAVYLGLSWFYRKGWSELTPDQVGDLMVWIVIGVLVGGRLGYCLLYDFSTTLRDPLSVVAFWRSGGISGMASHGGMAGSIAAMWLYTRRHRLSFWGLTDNAALWCTIGLGLGRVANFINGELWGRPATVPWAVIFPEGVAAGGEVPPRHPSQLYEAFGEGLFLFVFLFWLRSRHPRRGVVSGAFLVGYALVRIAAEFFREPDTQIGYWFGWVTQGQLLSLIPLAAGIAIVAWAVRNGSCPVKEQARGSIER